MKKNYWLTNLIFEFVLGAIMLIGSLFLIINFAVFEDGLSIEFVCGVLLLICAALTMVLAWDSFKNYKALKKERE